MSKKDRKRFKSTGKLRIFPIRKLFIQTRILQPEHKIHVFHQKREIKIRKMCNKTSDEFRNYHR